MDEHAQTAGNFLDNRHDAERRIAALEAELAAERERREAAEAILHMIDEECGFGSPLMKDLDAHFARYKD